MSEDLAYIRNWLRTTGTQRTQNVQVRTPTGLILIRLYTATLNPGEEESSYVVVSGNRRRDAVDPEEACAILSDYLLNHSEVNEISVFKYFRR